MTDLEASRAPRSAPATDLESQHATYIRIDRVYIFKVLVSVCICLVWFIMYYLTYALLDSFFAFFG